MRVGSIVGGILIAVAALVVVVDKVSSIGRIANWVLFGGVAGLLSGLSLAGIDTCRGEPHGRRYNLGALVHLGRCNPNCAEPGCADPGCSGQVGPLETAPTQGSSLSTRLRIRVRQSLLSTARQTASISHRTAKTARRLRRGLRQVENNTHRACRPLAGCGDGRRHRTHGSQARR